MEKLGHLLQWLPRRKGLAAGIIVSGFGAGAFVFDQVQTAFINPHNVRATTNLPESTEKYHFVHLPSALHACYHCCFNVTDTLMMRMSCIEQDCVFSYWEGSILSFK